MKVVIQRVSRGSVAINGKTVGKIGKGYVILLGIAANDGEADIDYLVEKIVHLRVFEDAQGKMNLSLLDVGGSVLVISQFTLYANTRKGRRPSFINAAPPEIAIPLYEKFVTKMRRYPIDVQTGEFGAMMSVDICNEGPVTIIIDSEERLLPRKD
jgi:D-tyrosyl-tRNA(Tyr) deacylase